MQDHLGRTNFANIINKLVINIEVEAHYKQQRLIMIKLTRKNESKDFQTVADLFKTTRQERNKYFGTYLAEVTDERPLELGGLVKKVEEQVEMYEELLKNLKGLKVEVEKEVRIEKSMKTIENLDVALEDPETKGRAIERLKELGLIPQ